MKLIKQRNESYVGYESHLETLIEKLIYHPVFRKSFTSKYRKGTFSNLIRGFFKPVKAFQGPGLSPFNLHHIAVSHLDAAWLWPVVETKIRAYKTFYKAVEHCEEFPFLTFTETSPQYYDWIKCYSPEKLWPKVKQMVKDKRIEPTGGMWIEPDLECPSGESLVRQRLFGQLWYQREFGFMPTEESLLDVFGFPFSLPQILIKSGAKAFWTTKCVWNDTTKWPISNYMWEGIDGSQIFTHQFSFQLPGVVFDLKRYLKTSRYPSAESNHAVLNSHLTNSDIENKFSTQPDDRCKEIGVMYGLGDGGRGPLAYEVMLADMLVQNHHGIHDGFHTFFETLRKEVGDRYLIWKDEMYLEFHRGCKTSQVEVKHFNRRAEEWVIAAENLMTMTKLLKPTGFDYQKKTAWEIWQKILFNQFHDILPGSSIPDVYVLAVKEQKQAITLAQDLIKQCFEKIGSAKDSLSVFNPFAWSRSEYITIDKQLYYLPNVNGLNFQQIPIATAKVNPNTWQTFTETLSTFVLENEVFRATISKNSGNICSLFLKSIQTEIIDVKKSYNQLGTGLRVFHEKPLKYPAWNLDHNYAKKPIAVKLIEKPTLKHSVEGIPQIYLKFKFLHSTAILILSVRPKDPLLYLDIHADIKDPMILVKYFVPLALESEDVVSDIPYGSISRKRIKRTEQEKAKWEMAMQRWIDISDVSHGLSIFNNNRYGFNATKNGVYITLVRTPVYPSPAPYFSVLRTLAPKDRPKYIEIKPHEFHLALYPHIGGWQLANVIQKAANFNFPLISPESVGIVANNSILPVSKETKILEIMGKSLLEIEKPNIIFGACKPSEWMGSEFNQLTEHASWFWKGDHFILRLAEQYGLETTTKIKFHSGLQIQKVEEVNLLEQNGSEVKIAENGITVKFTPFEIKTFRIRCANK